MENLAPIDPFQGHITRTPCFTCRRRWEDKDFCAPVCAPLTTFKIQGNMLRLFSESRPIKASKPYQTDSENLTNREQFYAGRKALMEIKRLTRYTSVQLSQRWGCSPFILNSIIREGQKRMNLTLFQQILEYREAIAE